jgi:putative adenylate-forming enzyme
MIQSIRDYLLLKKHQKRFSQEKITKLQLKSLKQVISYAKRNSLFYAEKYQNLPFKSLEDIKKLPTINKESMMENFSSLNTCGIDKDDVLAYAIKKEIEKDYLGYYQDRYVIGLSSGTSGNKGIYITPKKMTKRLPAVFLARSGLSIFDLPMRILFCLRVFSQGFNDINAPLIKLNYLSTMTNPSLIIETMNEKKVNILMAPPSLIRFLVPLKTDLKVKLKKIVTYAEVLTVEDKKLFEDTFQTKVIEIYQASEGQMASACKHGKLHINEDLVFVELYDENHQEIKKPHVVGHQMIITNLINYAQPLIRYEMNDMIVLDEPCSCGSNFRTIERIIGRRDDLLYFHNSNHEKKYVFPDLFARWIITESDLIREFQVYQPQVGQILISVDTPLDFPTQILESRIDNELKKLDLKAEITIQIVKIELPKDKNKFKRFITETL